MQNRTSRNKWGNEKYTHTKEGQVIKRSSEGQPSFIRFFSLSLSLSLSLYDFFLSLVHCCWSDGGRAMCALALANGPYFSILRLSLSPVVQEKSPRRPARALSLSLSLCTRPLRERKKEEEHTEEKY
jgi:hypothetical protein